MSGAIDFEGLNAAALARCPGLLEDLLPGGTLRGAEYVCGNLNGGAGASCSVNVHSGKWADFAAGQSGGDLISLLAEQRGVNQVEAARLLADMVGHPVATPPQRTNTTATAKPEAVMPVPAGVSLPADMKHPRLGAPAAVYEYRDAKGQLLGLVARFTKPDIDSRGKHHKEFAPRVYTAKGWRWQGFPTPRPLDGLQKLTETPAPAPVVLVEGEGKADSLQAVLGPSVPVLGLFGGSGGVGKMDFTPLAGRRVFFWPDADAPGAKAALASRSLLEKAGAESVAVAVPPEDAPQGWDAADAVGPDGWDRQQAQAFIRDASTTPAVFAKVAAQRWEVTPQEKVDTTAAAPAASPLRVVNVAEFLTLDLPEREMLLAPILPKQGLVMLHAARGIGKTYMGLSMAYAVASGGGIFGRWQALAPARVLYLDGEMPARTLQARIESIIEGNEEQPPAPDFLRFLTPDLQGGPMPNLATEAGQAALAPFLEGVELVVLDNLATLARHGRANDEESWTPVQGWLLELRRRGISVLLVHHQGKGGDQRGTSAKEDILDTVIRLDRPRDYQSEQGAVFEVRLTKARGIFGDDAKPFEAQLRDSGQGLTWLTRDIEEADLERLRRLLADGYSIRDAAEEMGKSKSAVDRLKRKLEAS